MKFLGYFKEQTVEVTPAWPDGRRFDNALAVWEFGPYLLCYTAIGQHSECVMKYVIDLPKLSRDQAFKIDPKTVREVENLYPETKGNQ